MQWTYRSDSVWTSGNIGEGFYTMIRRVYDTRGKECYELTVYDHHRPSAHKTAFQEIVGTMPTAKRHAAVAVRVLEWKP